MQRLLTTLAVLSIASASAAAATEVERSFDKRFDVKPGARLVLTHGDGELTITPWDEDAISVEVRYRVHFRRVGLGTDPDLDVRFEQDGDVVRVLGKEQSSGGVGFFSKDTVEHSYRVKAPPYVELDIAGDDGDVEIEGFEGRISIRNDDGDVHLRRIRSPEVSLEMEDGDLEIEDLEGPLEITIDDGNVEVSDCKCEKAEIEAEDGEIQVESCEGSFKVSTDDGDMELERITAGEMELSTGDGRIEAEVTAAAAAFRIEASSDDGDVVLKLGPGVSADYEVTTDGGRIEVETSGEGGGRFHKRATGKIGDGGGRIHVTTNDGNVTLRQSS